MNKESKNIKLSTVIVIITIILIATAVIAVLLYNKKINNNNLNENNQNSISKTENKISESEIKDLLNNYLNIIGLMQGSPYSVLEEMKKVTGKDIKPEADVEAVTIDGESLLPTNIKYSEFKEFMLNYMTEELFNSDFEKVYVNKDGELYCKNIGATGLEYEISSIEKVNESNTKYKAQINTVYSDTDKDEGITFFEIKEVNNKFVISDITYPGEIQEDNSSESSNKYKEITKELSETDVLEVTDSTKNNDGTYTLKGKISVVDETKELVAEYPERKFNGEYMKITVDGNTKCTYSKDSNDEETSTVDKVFSENLAFGICFNFKFENGKCISVYEVVVGH